MLAQTQTGTLAIIFEIDPVWEEVLGGYRMGRLHEVAANSVSNGLRQSYLVASTGAHRWPGNFRPEVLIDATGRML